MPFLNRREAGKLLGERLAGLPWVDPVVLALPRGGVPVGYGAALALDAPLDIIVVRKLGVPFQPEFALGAIGEDGVRVVDDEIVRLTGVSEAERRSVEVREGQELERRAADYRAVRAKVPLPGRTAIVVDDGIATGSTMRAACLVARAHGAARVIVAAPVASRQACEALREVADEVIVLEQPDPFFAVGQWYLEFDVVSDDDVRICLEASQQRRKGELTGSPAEHLGPDDPPDPPNSPARYADLELELGSLTLQGQLAMPESPRGLVLFVHGSGSSRHSPRNRFVARVLNEAGLSTLLFDLLTPDEELRRTTVFDIELLGGRLLEITEWINQRPETAPLPIGYLGASTGSAAALWAAGSDDVEIGAIVSRGGRPDLAGPRLAAVTAPTLLIVGERDEQVLRLNRTAQTVLTCESRLATVPRAAHLFEEPGTLQVAADLATNWFLGHLVPHAPGPSVTAGR